MCDQPVALPVCRSMGAWGVGGGGWVGGADGLACRQMHLNDINTRSLEESDAHCKTSKMKEIHVTQGRTNHGNSVKKPWLNHGYLINHG